MNDVRPPAAAALIALVLSVSACGGAADSTDPPGASATDPSMTTSEQPPVRTAAPPQTGASTVAPATTDPAGDSTTVPTEPAATTRTIETARGPVDVPIDPERITVLDEYAAMNLMAFGVEPTVVYGAYQSVVGQRALRAAGIEIREMEGFSLPNIEDVAATDPDLIVYTTEGAFADVYDSLSAVAPTVELPYTVPWRDAIASTATVVGQEAEADRVIGVIEDEIAALADEVAADPMSLSILGDTYGMVFAVSLESPLASVVEEIGFTRPDAQANGTPDTAFPTAIMISTEVLGEHDADAIAVLSGAFYEERTFLDARTFAALPAVQDGRSVVVDGDMWFGTFPFAIHWLIEDLRAIHAGEGQDGIGTADDTDARWAEFGELMAE